MQPHEVLGFARVFQQSVRLFSDGVTELSDAQVNFRERRSLLKHGGAAATVALLLNAFPFLAESVFAATAEAGAPTSPEQARLVDVPRNEFSPHFRVRRGSPTGEWAPMPNSFGVAAIELFQGKATIKLQDDAGINYWLDPLALQPARAAESPLKRLQRLVQTHNIPTTITDWNNKELLHRLRFQLTANEPNYRDGYIFDLSPNGDAIVWIDERLGERYFETDGIWGRVDFYPQLILVPQSMAQGFNPTRELLHNTTLADLTPTPLPTADEEAEFLELLMYPSKDRGPQRSTNNQDWRNNVGYSVDYESLRKATLAATAADLLRQSSHQNMARERTYSEYIVDVLHTLYPNHRTELASVVIRNSFVIDDVVYLAGRSIYHTDQIWKLSGNALPEKHFDFQLTNPTDRFLFGAFPIPSSDDSRYWIISYEQPVGGINNSLELMDRYHQTSQTRRKVRFIDEEGEPLPDLYCSYGKYDPTGRYLILTRYGFGTGDSVRTDEGGGEWVVDMQELAALIALGGTDDIIMPATRITDIHHSFSQTFTDRSFAQEIRTPPTASLYRRKVFLPAVWKNAIMSLLVNTTQAFSSHKRNRFRFSVVPRPPVSLLELHEIGLTTGWNPNVLYYTEEFTNQGRKYLLVIHTYPRTNMGYEGQSIRGIVLMEQLPDGSYRYVDPSEL